MRLFRRPLHGLVGLVLSLSPVFPAETTRLSAEEIQDLLSDRTIDGTWNARPYSQRFDANGWTLYESENAPPEQGKWRVNPETNSYESWWERGGWSSYEVLLEEGQHFWRGSNGTKQPFTPRPRN